MWREGEGISKPWVPKRGLREVVLKTCHQAVMRVATEERRREAEKNGKKMGQVGVCQGSREKTLRSDGGVAGLVFVCR